MTTISAETILSSQHASANARLDTQLWTYPRWIHAEGRTHRILRIAEDMEVLVFTPAPMEDPFLSRNAASSRAIPVAKMIEAIRADPAVPLFWGKNIAGMQAKEELGPAERQLAYDIWMRSMESAIAYATEMCRLGIDEEERLIGAHKQIVNRILEPYMHIKVLASATEWLNFLELRDHGDAEPHIAMLARAVRAELAKPAMQVLQPGQWHLPFVDRAQVDAEIMAPYLDDSDTSGAHIPEEVFLDAAKKLSVARCASTSYKTVDGFDMTLKRAIELHDKLVGSRPIHASPCEHVAQADGRTIAYDGSWTGERWAHSWEHANFVGFRQYRHQLVVAH